MSFVSSKVRSLFGSSTPAPNTPPTSTVDHHFRPFSMVSSVTAVPPSPIAPAHEQPSTLATLQYQQDLLADFWSGTAAPRPRAPSPPTSSSSHGSSVGSSVGKKTKWASAIQVREERRARAEVEAYPEPKTHARWLFLFGFILPLLWLVGAFLIFFPTTPNVQKANLPVHSTEERERRVAVYRKSEEKWAKRCLWAWVCVMAAVAVIAVAVDVANKGGS